MTTKPIAIFIMLVCSVFAAVAQVFLKKGANVLEYNFYSIITNYSVFIGLAIYFFAFFLMLFAFRRGEVSVLYPVISLSYVWVSFLAAYFFSEAINVFKWSGIVVIIIGITFIGLGRAR